MQELEGPIIIDGKKLAKEVEDELRVSVAEIKKQGKATPHLAAIMVGHNGGSEAYISNMKCCDGEGFETSIHRFEEDITEEEILKEVEKLNQDPNVHGIIVQLPLPKTISQNKVIEAIDYRKDVDGFHPINMGRLVLGLPSFIPATPAGILEIIKRSGIKTEGKHCVVLGRSNIVGKPIANLMMRKGYPGNSTVTVCHSRSENLKELCLEADILIVALGMPEFVRGDMVKEGAVVIDVGTTRLPSSATKSGYKLFGDVKFDEVAPKCSYITPVPGGVGQMTSMCLMRNTILSALGKIF